MIGYLTTNNAADHFVIFDDAGDFRTAYTIDGADAFRSACAVGEKQDLYNWSGDSYNPDVTKPEDFGDVIAVNDGETLQVEDERLFAQRREFWLGEEAAR